MNIYVDIEAPKDGDGSKERPFRLSEVCARCLRPIRSPDLN